MAKRSIGDQWKEVWVPANRQMVRNEHVPERSVGQGRLQDNTGFQRSTDHGIEARKLDIAYLAAFLLFVHCGSEQEESCQIVGVSIPDDTGLRKTKMN